MALSKRRKKTLWIVLGSVAGLIVVVLLVVILGLDTWVRLGVEVGGSRVLGVKMRLDGASVSLLRGRIALKGLDIGNPEGFNSPDLVKADLIRVGAVTSSLFKNDIHLTEVTLDGPEFTYEYVNGKSNVQALLDKLESGAKPKEEGKPKKEPARLKIDRLHITNAKIHVVMMNTRVNAGMPDLDIANIADENGNGVPADQVAKVILNRLLEQMTDSVGNTAKEAAGQLETGVKQLGDSLKESGGKLGEGMKKLFGK